MTVSVEEHFHGAAFAGVVSSRHWDRFDSRIDRSVDEALRLFERHRAKATFFVLGVLAERFPEVVRRIAAAGHEIAASGFWPRGAGTMQEAEFADDLDRTAAALEAACGRRILGYRCPRWIGPEDLWILDVLARKGYRYDSSVRPIGRRFRADRRFLATGEHELPASGRTLWEVPVSTVGCVGCRAAISTGESLRLLPPWLLAAAAARWMRRRPDPLVFCIDAWELDHGQPRIRAAPRSVRRRAYRNLERTGRLLGPWLERYRFTSIADWLHLPHEPVETLQPRRTADEPALASALDGKDRVAVSVVVPIYNEAENIGYLMRTLDSLLRRLGAAYEFTFVLVDDGSSDTSWQRLTEVTGGRSDVKLVRHERNRGVAAAIQTGIAAAPTEIVCSIDSDCSYDPLELERMLPMIEGADVVTASPYHREGRVSNVPGWRLFLSRGLSRLYRVAVPGDLSTWTSCFRVYRRSRVVDVAVEHGGFLGVAEQVVRLLRRGRVVREYPTLLESRLLGTSKMKTLRTIRGHLAMLWRVLRGTIR